MKCASIIDPDEMIISRISSQKKAEIDLCGTRSLAMD
jgi:hypothetical protein